MAPGSASATKPASAVTAARRVSVLTLPSLEIVTRGGIMDSTPSARYPRAMCSLYSLTKGQTAIPRMVLRQA